jgi:uncharacterized membrane protein YjgN (DUF898 family)
VDPAELTFGVVLVLVLLGLAGYFTWRQIGTLRQTRNDSALSTDDRLFLHRQAVRRLVCSALMVVLAGMLIGWYFLDPAFRDMFREGREAWAEARDEILTEQQKDFSRWMAAYWSLALLVLFFIIVLAAMDAWAIGRYGLRQRRQLSDERRQALLELEAARRRHRENGQG